MYKLKAKNCKREQDTKKRPNHKYLKVTNTLVSVPSYSFSYAKRESGINDWRASQKEDLRLHCPTTATATTTCQMLQNNNSINYRDINSGTAEPDGPPNGTKGPASLIKH